MTTTSCPADIPLLVEPKTLREQLAHALSRCLSWAPVGKPKEALPDLYRTAAALRGLSDHTLRDIGLADHIGPRTDNWSYGCTPRGW